jgi:hypothetical protein
LICNGVENEQIERTDKKRLGGGTSGRFVRYGYYTLFLGNINTSTTLAVTTFWNFPTESFYSCQVSLNAFNQREDFKRRKLIKFLSQITTIRIL